MKLRIFLVVVLCCLGLFVLGGTAAADPPDRVVGAGHAVLTDPGGGGNIGGQIDFRIQAWEATDHRPAGGWMYIKVMDADGVVLNETTMSFAYVKIENGMAAMAGRYDGDIWVQQMLTDLGQGQQGARDTIRPSDFVDEAQAATWVEEMFVPQRTWTLTYGNIQVIE